MLQNGVPRLADFGLSRAMSAETASGMPAGTPAFMAPEAFDGVRSERTDLWSVGVMFYLLLSGSLPFQGRDWTSLFKSIVTRDPAPLPGDVPLPIRAVVEACLEKDPGRRLPSASQASTRLRAARQELSALRDSVRVAVHVAAFAGSQRFALFINATNLSQSVDRELTHVWIEAEPKIHVVNEKRPLPKRLKPQETWETWVELWQIPSQLLRGPFQTLVRAKLSNGEIISAVLNENVPEYGFVPGGHPADANAETPLPPGSVERFSTERDEGVVPRNRPWWRFW
jgi:serine/threonine protein kinase